MSNNVPFTFHSHFNSLSLQNPVHPSPAAAFQTNHYEGGGDSGGSRKRKSSYEDISPLVMKTRSGIGLEEEIVYGMNATTFFSRSVPCRYVMTVLTIVATNRILQADKIFCFNSFN